jgi:hypothetical protein
MRDLLQAGGERTILIRLTALWALNEAGLGGLMHLFKSPFTGIFVGGTAVLLISLIGYVAKKPGPAIMRALTVVLIIKAMASPHSPLTAYLAVAFQGVMGAVLFTVLPSFRLAALLLGPLALVESAIQKLLVMTLLFGTPLWKSLDAFLDSVLQKLGVLAEGAGAGAVYWIAGTYVGTYLFAGLLIGWLAGKLPAEVSAAAQRLRPPGEAEQALPQPPRRKKRVWWKRPLWWLLALVMIVSVVLPGAVEDYSPLWIVVRVFGLIAIWYFLIGPVLMGLLQRFLKKRESAYHEEVSAALDLMPVFRHLARTAWQETRDLKGWSRSKELVVRVVTYALLFSKK